MRKTFLNLSLITFFLFLVNVVNAQIDSSDIAKSFSLEGSVEGSVVCSSQTGLALCAKAYSPSIYGVVTSLPAVAIRDNNIDNEALIAQGGTVAVRITSKNGNIQEGDFITSSDIEGVAQKAAKNGYVLGTALEPFQSVNPDEIGSILVSVHIHPETSFTDEGANLLETLEQALTIPILTPLAALRYLLASLIVTLSFVIGFIYFGKVLKMTVENIARNPSVKIIIYFTSIISLVIIAAAVFAGLYLAYLILVL